MEKYFLNTETNKILNEDAATTIVQNALEEMPTEYIESQFIQPLKSYNGSMLQLDFISLEQYMEYMLDQDTIQQIEKLISWGLLRDEGGYVDNETSEHYNESEKENAIKDSTDIIADNIIEYSEPRAADINLAEFDLEELSTGDLSELLDFPQEILENCQPKEIYNMIEIYNDSL